MRGRSPEARARAALTAAFVANGIFFGTLAARVPAIKDRLGLSDGALGLALLFVAVGSLCAFPLVGRLIATLGSRPVTRVALVLDAAGIGLVALAPSLATLIVAAFLLGAANAGLDVAMNAHGVALEGRYGRPILSSFHAGWSIGGLVGAALGGLLAAAGLDVRLHLVVVPLAACAVALALTRRLLPAGEDTAPPLPALRMPSRRVAMLGLIAFCSLFAEGVAADWSAVYLKDSLGAGAGLAAVAFAAYALTMAAGRLVGDRLTVRWGPSGLLVRCGLVAGAGLATALVIGHPGRGDRGLRPARGGGRTGRAGGLPRRRHDAGRAERPGHRHGRLARLLRPDGGPAGRGLRRRGDRASRRARDRVRHGPGRGPAGRLRPAGSVPLPRRAPGRRGLLSRRRPGVPTLGQARPADLRPRRAVASTVTASSSTAPVTMNLTSESSASRSMPLEIDPITSAPSSADHADAAAAEQAGAADDGGGDRSSAAGRRRPTTGSRRTAARRAMMPPTAAMVEHSAKTTMRTRIDARCPPGGPPRRCRRPRRCGGRSACGG